jgi:signal transduction histidine kinase
LTNALNFASGELPAHTTVGWKLPPRVRPAYAQGVQNLIEMVIINLMLNAFQAMPEGGRMSIGLRFDGSEIVIEIGDTGPGIAPEHVTKIFDPFFTTGGDKRRSGLGLSVSIRSYGSTAET